MLSRRALFASPLFASMGLILAATAAEASTTKKKPPVKTARKHAKAAPKKVFAKS